jgi:hypothetical protein
MNKTHRLEPLQLTLGLLDRARPQNGQQGLGN